MTPEEIRTGLAHFTGTDRIYRHSLVRHVRYTDGIQFLAGKASAYWLIDKIASLQMRATVRNEVFQVWRLKVAEDNSAILEADDGNGVVFYREKILFTDFPLPEIRLYVVDSTIMLPGEY